MKSVKNKIFCLFFIIFTGLLSSCSLKDYIKNAVLSNIPGVRMFMQKDFSTYTSITAIKDEMKLVTGKQQIDFINIMDGKDGRYLEISTFEIRAGIDCSKVNVLSDNDGNKTFQYPEVEVFSSNKIHSITPRTAAEKNISDFYENSIKPVNIAYEQKAKDYAVKLGLLENAKKGAQRTLKNLMDVDVDLQTGNYTKSYELAWLPFSIDIYSGYFEDNKMQVVPLEKDKFYRDSFLIKSTANDSWSIRIGDTGRTFNGTFEEFYRNVLETNSNTENSGNDRVEIFRYFDPMYPQECEVLGYASDYFRTMFFLNDGRIYYIDAVIDNQQNLINNLSPTMVYLAASMRKIKDYHIEGLDEYRTYISNFFDAQESIRTGESRVSIQERTNRLVQSNTIRQIPDDYSQDEKYFLAVSDVKGLGRTAEQNTVWKTGNSDFDDITALIKDLLVEKEQFASNESREKAITASSRLDSKIYHTTNKKSANSQYLETWFLQNAEMLDLTETERQRYETDIKSGETYIASRPMLMTLGDGERNEYFYSLFRNKLNNSQFFVDTASNINNDMQKSVRGTNMFVYYKIPKFEEVADGDIYEQIKIKNGGHDIDNSFILVFNQTEWDWGNLGKDNDLHALVFDDATLRFFPNVGAISFVEDVKQEAKEIVGKVAKLVMPEDKKTQIDDWIKGGSGVAKFFFYGDWKNLKVSPTNVTIAGHNFATKRLTKKGKEDYRNSNDYAEKSVIATVIDDLQHAYCNDDTNYYYDILCSNLDEYIQQYVYKIIFRPSPRMIIDTREDAMQRYNY